jgi:hypothetical protein
MYKGFIKLLGLSQQSVQELQVPKLKGALQAQFFTEFFIKFPMALGNPLKLVLAAFGTLM